ncbi:hypothetical protein BKA65DRAFT_583206 [Rhexocercosporidium sp. MPI-PUGE-AT-0058]|nr:hypothetical protein BKA65DRAFT_583206 [Rhexocercosporidium sp. MPI-PUGE-AT-0058]
MLPALFTLAALLNSASAAILWDGRFSTDTIPTISSWSWSNQKGPYQWYIHGTGATSKYISTSASYKNPASSDALGLKLTIDSTAKWNSDMWRTELIPQTTAAINKGKVFYHFSVMHTSTNAPNPAFEHQVCFFESHFTELKFGWINGQATNTPDPMLRWYAGSQSRWNTNFTANVWHNVAFGIDFGANSVTFYHSTGADPLAQTAGPISTSTSSNGADWHLGVLRLPKSGVSDGGAEDWYYSGVYIESGTLTTSIAGPV